MIFLSSITTQTYKQIIQHELFLLLRSNYLYASPMMYRSCAQYCWNM